MLLEVLCLESCQEDIVRLNDFAFSVLVGIAQEFLYFFNGVGACHFWHLVIQENQLDRLNIHIRVLLGLNRFANYASEHFSELLSVECDLGSVMNLKAAQMLPDDLDVRRVILRKKNVNHTFILVVVHKVLNLFWLLFYLFFLLNQAHVVQT